MGKIVRGDPGVQGCSRVDVDFGDIRINLLNLQKIQRVGWSSLV